ncbi:MAG: SAM-dependent methyltransferase [Acidimicrobiales bacterium]
MSASDAIDSALGSDGLRFDSYVELALYGEEGGFFTSGLGAGRGGGDFLTSVEVGPLFGELITEALCRWMGSPVVYELGAGNGSLARGVLREMAARGVVCEYTVVERSALALSQAPPDIERLTQLPGGQLDGVVIANELLDNLPFRVLRRSADSGIEELFVISDGAGGFDESWIALSHDDVAMAVDEVPGLDGFAPLVPFPWAREARRLVEDVSARCDRLVLLDYGASTYELLERGIQGWLRTFVGHEVGRSPLVDPGSQDITIDVPFDQLPAPRRRLSQADFLGELGIDDLVAEGKRIWAEQAARPGLVAMKARSRISESEALLDPEGMGGFQVLEYVRS